MYINKQPGRNPLPTCIIIYVICLCAATSFWILYTVLSFTDKTQNVKYERKREIMLSFHASREINCIM